MNNACIIYLVIYTIYVIFGYDLITNLIESKTIKTINGNNCVKRILQLSLITLLCNALLMNNNSIDITLFLIVALLNVVVSVGYFLKFYPKDNLTGIFHVILALPILFLPCYCRLNGNINWYIVLCCVIILLLYKLLLEKYVYGK